MEAWQAQYKEFPYALLLYSPDFYIAPCLLYTSPVLCVCAHNVYRHYVSLSELHFEE